MEINKILAEFGLKNKEDDVYLACLELGSSSVVKIAKKAGIKRTTVYDVLTALESKGLIGQTVKGKKRLFYAESPDKLKKLLDEKKSKLNEIMPILRSLYNTAGSKPKIRYYEGKEGIKEVYIDTLNYPKSDLLAFENENIIKYLGEDFAADYMAKRVKAKIFAKVIVPDSPDMIEYKKADKPGYKKTKVVSKDKFPFSMEMNIYGNKVGFMSFKEGMGIIIESNEIANNLRYLFELSWKGAGVKVGKTNSRPQKRTAIV